VSSATPLRTPVSGSVPDPKLISRVTEPVVREVPQPDDDEEVDSGRRRSDG
jgi:hypothetical protein